MSVIDLSAVMVDLAAAAQTVLATGYKAHPQPVEGAQAGDAIVGYPQDPIDITTTFRRGQDRCVVPVWFLCGLSSAPATRTAVSALIGSASVVAAIEAYAGTWSSVKVATARIETFTPINGNEQLAVRFDVDVIS